jgi:putative FmdB family regulatory protein
MPVYEYECQDCEKVFEVQQRISDDPLSSCPECQGQVKKLMSMSSFQLKGSGWYADGYASSSASKNGNGKATTEKAAPACETKSAGCAGCPAAAAN